ncbi:YbgA family protein [Streptococcus canis]|nr:YbgA family protein [Streptococcus canis]
MAHSQQHYNALRDLFKGNQWSEETILAFCCLIEEAQGILSTT